MLNVAALIIGIDGWEQYTEPLINSIKASEPLARIVVIDNASAVPYPDTAIVHRTERLCYSAAINKAAELAGECDWYIILSNDVLCNGPFIEFLSKTPSNNLVGPCLKKIQDKIPYLEGWCVAASGLVWRTLGGWDANFKVSSWEDVDFSLTAIKCGFGLAYAPDFPFVHLDQKQRFTLIPDYWASEDHNIKYFAKKHGYGA